MIHYRYRTATRLTRVTLTANATEEFFVRRSPLYEVVGQLGMWGTLINGIQAASLEHHDMTQASWNGATSTFFSKVHWSSPH